MSRRHADWMRDLTISASARTVKSWILADCLSNATRYQHVGLDRPSGWAKADILSAGTISHWGTGGEEAETDVVEGVQGVCWLSSGFYPHRKAVHSDRIRFSPGFSGISPKL
jgi:hypothetical protein